MPSQTFFPFDSAEHYERLRDRLILFLERRGCCCAEDVVDEAILRILDGRAALKPGASLDQWAYGVARRVCHEWRRHVQRFPALQNPEAISTPVSFTGRLDAVKALSVLSPYEQELLGKLLIDKVGTRAEAILAGLTDEGMRSRVHRLKTRVRVSVRIQAPSAFPVATKNSGEICPVY